MMEGTKGNWYRRLWAPDGPDGMLYRALGGLLAPAEWLYRMGVAVRSWAYDRNLLSAAAVPIPTLGIGNLTVGGTGKTPVAAWFARELVHGGHRPAIVLRGYGGDEETVHRVLNPRVRVYPSSDRMAALERARAAGCDVAVLDDVFQHRSVRVRSHVVLVAAEEWGERPRLLPRGPWREPLSSLRRADLVVVTRKTAGAEAAQAVLERLLPYAPNTPHARAHIAVRGLARYDPAGPRLGEIETGPSSGVALALAGVARPEAFREQLAALGIAMGAFRAFPDHHRYDEREIRWIRRRAREGPVALTLKDAVKLGPALSPEVELRVGVQSVEWESGLESMGGLLGELLPGRADR